MSEIVLLNGRFVEYANAFVSVHDGGFLHGAGLFETMCARNGRVFQLDAHLMRIRRSASALIAPLEEDDLPSHEMFSELLERNDKRAARVRLTVTAGSMHADQEDRTGPAPTVCATVGDHAVYGAEFYDRGVTVALSPFKTSPTDPTAGHKTIGYMPRLLALRTAQQAKCFESIWFTTENYLAEGSISNLFVVSNNTLKTPGLKTPVLPGIARQVVMDIATSLGMPCEECPLTINDLLDADEVFLTNALMHVMPVVGVEKSTIGRGEVGNVSKSLLQEYRNQIRKECRS